MQCQNWTTTYNGKEIALTPREAALLMSDAEDAIGWIEWLFSEESALLNGNGLTLTIYLGN